MTKLWSTLLAVAVMTLATAVQPACVFACQCLPPGPPEDARAAATAVFSGQVTAIAMPATSDGIDPLQVTFAVSQHWKGMMDTTVIVVTPSASASCGLDFVVGQTSLVYAHTSDGRLQTTLCSRTTTLATAAADLVVLGPGTTSTPSPAGGTRPPHCRRPVPIPNRSTDRAALRSERS